jgi:hypothetical protein
MTRAEALEAMASLTDADLPTATSDELFTPEGLPITDEMVEDMVAAASRPAGRPSLTGAGGRSPQVTMRLPRDLYDLLEDYRAAHGLDRAEVMRAALEAHLRSPAQNADRDVLELVLRDALILQRADRRDLSGRPEEWTYTPDQEASIRRVYKTLAA